MAFVQRHPMLAALAVVAALLAGIIALELTLGAASLRRAAETSTGAPTEMKLVPAIVAIAPEQAYPETAARPLFSPTRRPAPEAPSAQTSAMVRGQFSLQGVTIVGDTRIALLREKASGRTHRVERGKDVSGMTLASVDADRVVLTLGADREELVLIVQKGQAPSAQAGVAPPGMSAPQVQVPTQAPGPIAPAAQNPSAANVPHPVTGAGPFLPPGFAPAQAPAPASPPAAPAQSSAAPGTPEELLARRRARRVQQPAQ